MTYIYCDMITTVNLVNIHYLIQEKKKQRKCSFPWMKTSRIYSLSNFPVYPRAVLTKSSCCTLHYQYLLMQVKWNTCLLILYLKYKKWRLHCQHLCKWQITQQPRLQEKNCWSTLAQRCWQPYFSLVAVCNQLMWGKENELYEDFGCICY